MHDRILRKTRANLIERVIEREIIHQYFRRHAGKVQRFPNLLDVNRRLTNSADKSAALFLPMKNLTGIERHREVKIRCPDLP